MLICSQIENKRSKKGNEMRLIFQLIALAIYVTGIVIAKTTAVTVFAVIFPPFSWLVVIAATLGLY